MPTFEDNQPVFAAQLNALEAIALQGAQAYDILSGYAIPEIPGASSKSYQSRVGLYPTVYDFGATGDGSTDDTSAFQDAIDWSNQYGRVVLVPYGHYLITQPLSIPANATFLGLVCDLKARIAKMFNTAGSSGLIVCADPTGAGDGTTRPKNIYIYGGDWGCPYVPSGSDFSATSADYTGNIFAITVDNLNMIDTQINGMGTGARFFVGGGNGFKIIRPNWKYTLRSTGCGGCRITAGGGLVADGSIYSGDDVLQPVQAATGVYANGDIDYIAFRDMIGESWEARFAVVAMTDQSVGPPVLTCNTLRVDYIRCHGYGKNYGIYVTNQDSTGQIKTVNFIDCEITGRGTELTTPMVALLDGGSNSGSRGGAPGIEEINFVRTKLIGGRYQSIECQNEIGTLRIIDSITGPTNSASGPLNRIEKVTNLEIIGGKAQTILGQDAYQFGSISAASKSVDNFLVSNHQIPNMPDDGAAGYSYGYNIVRCTQGIFKDRALVSPYSGSVYIRFATIGANAVDVYFQSLDLRSLTAPTKFIDNGTRTRFGDDLLMASGAPYNDLTQTLDATGLVTIAWDGISTQIKVLLTAPQAINNVSVPANPVTPVRVTIYCVNNFVLTVNAAPGSGGNVYMPANVALAHYQSIDLQWDPISNYWHGI